LQWIRSKSPEHAVGAPDITDRLCLRRFADWSISAALEMFCERYSLDGCRPVVRSQRMAREERTIAGISRAVSSPVVDRTTYTSCRPENLNKRLHSGAQSIGQGDLSAMQ
jgi:hypothetical protein